ncbi:hypothetical protein [Nostoc sp. NOS(2021)]|nr:hypothetical protein [Nostoc sp. NOS(2021)]
MLTKRVHSIDGVGVTGMRSHTMPGNCVDAAQPRHRTPSVDLTATSC